MLACLLEKSRLYTRATRHRAMLAARDISALEGRLAARLCRVPQGALASLCARLCFDRDLDARKEADALLAELDPARVGDRCPCP